MNQLNVNLPELPYAVSEAMNRLRINIKSVSYTHLTLPTILRV